VLHRVYKSLCRLRHRFQLRVAGFEGYSGVSGYSGFSGYSGVHLGPVPGQGLRGAQEGPARCQEGRAQGPPERGQGPDRREEGDQVRAGRDGDGLRVTHGTGARRAHPSLLAPPLGGAKWEDRR